MATMNIKDPEVRRLALELARVRGISMTEAVRQAVNEALRHDRQSDEDYIARGLRLADAIRKEMADAGAKPLTDDDLYDERGLPR
jgi:antitoxin VapB